MQARVLFVENTPDVARAVAAMLERHRFDVVREDDHRRATDRVATERYDVLLVEVRVAAEDPGLGLLRHIHHNAPHLTARIVVISNDAPPSVRRELEAIGVCDIILKPVHEDEILSAIAECLDRSPASVQ